MIVTLVTRWQVTYKELAAFVVDDIIFSAKVTTVYEQILMS